MKIEDLRRAHKSFSLSKSTAIYLREREVSAISSFLRSKQLVLHVCGNPGTGKTHVTTTLLGTSSLYLNYYNEDNIPLRIKTSRKTVVIIDEFDKYYNEKRGECLRTMCYLKDNGIKLITLSNDLRISADALFFRPYTSLDMEKILDQKLRRDPDVEVATQTAIRIMSRKLGCSGDLRPLFKYVQEVIEKKLLDNDVTAISAEDLTHEKENEAKVPSNIHHEIISTLVSGNRRATGTDLYPRYLRECLEMDIQPYDRTDFNIVHEIYR